MSSVRQCDICKHIIDEQESNMQIVLNNGLGQTLYKDVCVLCISNLEILFKNDEEKAKTKERKKGHRLRKANKTKRT